MSTLASRDEIEHSRRRLAHELGFAHDLTVIRAPGDWSDELSWAGAQALLSEAIYREVDLESLCAAGGHTALLLAAGDSFCRPVDELIARVLAIAELRFERVIVLPASFDPSDDVVRDALSASGATVFAREPASFERIAPLCDARLAHDCAFFGELVCAGGGGRGTLELTDEQRAGDGLDRQLEQIAAHELIRTDRAGVVIAAALLGRRVAIAAGADPSLASLARYTLAERDVEVEPSPAPARIGPPRAPIAEPARVTAVVLTRDRPERALKAVDSVAHGSLADTLVLDNNSAPRAAARLQEGCAPRDRVTLRRSDRNLGCAGGRRLAIEETDTELILFLDDDAELEPGALELLVAELDSHPEAGAVTATVAFPDGTIHHSGGWLSIEQRAVGFALIGAGERSPDPLPPTGPAGWVPGTAVLIRRSLLQEFPIDGRMRSYFEDNEWCYRVETARPGSFRRSREARAVHHFTDRHGPGVDFRTRSVAVGLLSAHARFYERHGKLLDLSLFDLVPELRVDRTGRDAAAARLLMELLCSRGSDWTLMAWMNGDLDPLLRRGRRIRELRAERDRAIADHRAQQEQLAFLMRRHETLQQVETGGWWRLRTRLLPALELGRRLRTAARR